MISQQTTEECWKGASLSKCKGHRIEICLKDYNRECPFTKCDCSACERIESRNVAEAADVPRPFENF